MEARQTRPCSAPDWLARLRSADVLYVTDEQQRIIMWSPSAEQVLGYRAEEVLGRPCYAVIAGLSVAGHPVCRPGCPAAVNARRGRVTSPYEVLAQRRDGERVWLNSGVTLVPVEPNRVPLLLHVCRRIPAPHPQPTPPGRRPRQVQGADAPPVPNAEHLSRRELEVLRLLAAGQTTAEIAATLGISRLTARNHLASAQHKLGVRNRVEAVLAATEAGLV